MRRKRERPAIDVRIEYGILKARNAGTEKERGHNRYLTAGTDDGRILPGVVHGIIPDAFVVRGIGQTYVRVFAPGRIRRNTMVEIRGSVRVGENDRVFL